MSLGRRAQKPPGRHLHGQRGNPRRDRPGPALPARPHLQDHPDLPGDEADRRQHQVQAHAALAGRAGRVLHGGHV